MTRNQSSKYSHPASTEGQPRDADEPIKIRVLTHNIRYATQSPFKGEEFWEVRCPRLCAELVFNSKVPETFICLQEVLHSQLQDILAALNASTSSGSEWAYLGIGRDDGEKAGEYSPIFYRPSVWKLIQSESRWLSETPSVPSRGWDAANNRILTIGVFDHYKAKNQQVIVATTHFDHVGSVARKESAKVILKRVAYYTELRKVGAILVAGDFNSPPEDGAYKIMTSPDSVMEDVGIQIPKEKRYGNEMTFTSFGHIDNNPSRIDFIFSRKGDNVTYETFGVLTNRFDDGVYTSDHRACVADLTLGK